MVILDRSIPPSFISSSNTAVSNAAIEFTNDFQNKIMGTPFTSSEGSWWSIYHVYDTGSSNYDKVWVSYGNPDFSSGSVQGGDARLYVRVSCSAGGSFQVTSYVDYSINPPLGVNQNQSSQNLTIDTAENFRYVVWTNPYEVFCLLDQDTETKKFISFGQPIRTHIQERNTSRAFTTAVANAGANVTVGLDRNISGIATGSTIHIIALTPSGSAASSYTYDTTTVNAVTTNSITFANLNNSYSASAIVGVDPSAIYTSVGSTISTGVDFSNMPNQAYRALNGNDHTYDIDTATPEVHIDPSEYADNDFDGHQGFRCIIQATTTNYTGPRGHTGILTAWDVPASGIQSSDDRFRANYDNARIFYPLSGTIGTFSSLMFAIPLPSGSNI